MVSEVSPKGFIKLFDQYPNDPLNVFDEGDQVDMIVILRDDCCDL